MIALFVFMIILSLLIIIHEFGHFIVAKRIGVRVEEFSLGFGPQLFRKKKGDTVYTLSLIPLGGFVKLAGDNLEEYKGRRYEYFSRSIPERFRIIFFGPLLNYIMGFVFFWLIFFIGYPTLTTKVGGLLDGFGAKEAGLEAGDKIVAVDSKKVELWEDLQRLIQEKKKAGGVDLSIVRGNKEYTVKVKIKEKEFNDGLGRKQSVGLLGITPFDEVIIVKHGFFHSFILGARKTLGLTAMTYIGLWQLVSGRVSLQESVTGPLGIFFITSKVASMGIIAVLHLIAVLSVSLAIFNLLPLPVLDGGHILFLAIEKIRRKTFSIKTERIITQVGITMLICLAIFVTYNDILRIFGDKIHKFFIK